MLTFHVKEMYYIYVNNAASTIFTVDSNGI